MKCRGGTIINLDHDSSLDHVCSDVFMYMSCDIIMNTHCVDELVTVMRDNDIDILIIGGRGQYDKCHKRISCKSGIVSRCYKMVEAYAILSLINLDNVFDTSCDYLMKEVVRVMCDTHARSDAVPRGCHIQCIYPCVAFKCPGLIKSSSDMESINIYCMPDKLTASSIDPVYYFFAIVIVVVVLCIIIACLITLRRSGQN